MKNFSTGGKVFLAAAAIAVLLQVLGWFGMGLPLPDTGSCAGSAGGHLTYEEC